MACDRWTPLNDAPDFPPERIGPGADRLVRLNHAGRRARFDIVLVNVPAYGMALGKFGLSPDLAAAAKAVAAHYGEA